MIAFIARNYEPILVTLLTAFLVWLGSSLYWLIRHRLDAFMARQDKQDALLADHNKILKAITYDRFHQLCRYHLRQGSISINELHNLDMMYQAYHNLLDLNGTGTELYNRCCKLSIVQDDFLREGAQG